jgi:hypothetical protein
LKAPDSYYVNLKEQLKKSKVKVTEDMDIVSRNLIKHQQSLMNFERFNSFYSCKRTIY